VSGIARRWAASYRVRLAFGYLGIVAVFAVAWAWSLFGPLTSTVTQQQEDHLLAVAQAGALVLDETQATPQQFVEELVASTNLRVTIVAADGVVLADNEEDAAGMENHADRPEVMTALSGEPGSDRRVSATQGAERIYVAVPASYGGRTVALRVSGAPDGTCVVGGRSGLRCGRRHQTHGGSYRADRPPVSLGAGDGRRQSSGRCALRERRS
jgi:hypothetical protein